MEFFSIKQRDRAMQIICDYYRDERSSSDVLTSDRLHDFGLPKSVDAEQLVQVLRAMGLVNTASYYNDPSAITLTDLGKCYFERKAEKDREKHIENIRYIITTAIAVIALIKSFLPEILEALDQILPQA